MVIIERYIKGSKAMVRQYEIHQKNLPKSTEYQCVMLTSHGTSLLQTNAIHLKSV